MWSVDQANAMSDNWGFNCGPAAVCAVTGMTPEQLHPHLGDFEKKKYTNPTLMIQILKRLGIESRWKMDARGVNNLAWPEFGLVRVQWSGPWCRPGVPMRVRYRHTHWVATDARKSFTDDRVVFDINATSVGGWIYYDEWSRQLVPWLLDQIVPKSDGKWWPTHSVEIVKPQLVRRGTR